MPTSRCRGGLDGETLPLSGTRAPTHLTEAGGAVEIPAPRQLEKTPMAAENESYPKPVEFRAAPLSDAPCGPRNSVSADEIGKQRERNQKAVQLLKNWMGEDAEAGFVEWEFLKSELDRDRLSGRKRWLQPPVRFCWAPASWVLSPIHRTTLKSARPLTALEESPHTRRRADGHVAG